MVSNILIRYALRCNKDTLSNPICSMDMYYVVWIYNQIPNMQFGLYYMEICSRSRLDPVSFILSNCHVLGCLTYVLEPKFQNTGVKILSGIPGVE